MLKITGLTRRLLHCVFPKRSKKQNKIKEEKMLLDSYFDSAIIIDNIEEEGRIIERILNDHEIKTDFILFKPETEITSFKRNRKLIFMDLILDEDSSHPAKNISMLIRTLGTVTNYPDFGLYGLIVWSKHSENKEELQKRIGKACEIQNEKSEDDEEESIVSTLKNPPLFILFLDKSKYLKGDNYSILNEDLENLLKNDDAAYFYLEWSQSVDDAKCKAIKDVYRLIGDYLHHSEKFTYLLQRLAMNITGIKDVHKCQTIDAYKAFDELLYANLFCSQTEKDLPILNIEKNNLFTEDEKQKICAALNSKFFIDMEEITQEVVTPGNVYEILIEDSPLKIDLEEKYLEKINKNNIRFIGIELTPPCDFANKKINSRMVGGLICDVPLKNNGKVSDINAGEKCYSVNVMLEENINKLIIFDFRYLYTPKTEDLKDANKYKVIFRAKPKLFADILQKFSSHAARLGLSSITLDDK